MKTYEADLTSGAWVEILGGETSLYLDINGSESIRLNFHENGVPALDAPSVGVFANKGGWDFECSGLKIGQKIYAKSSGAAVSVNVVR